MYRLVFMCLFQLFLPIRLICEQVLKLYQLTLLTHLSLKNHRENLLFFLQIIRLDQKFFLSTSY